MSDGGGAAAGGPPPSGQQSMMSFLPPHDGAAAVAAPLAPHGANTQAAKLTFPGKVPVATRDAVLSYVAPPGFRIHPLTAKARSGAVYYGVKLDVLQDDGTVHPSDKRFACLASVGCRNSQQRLKLKNGSSTGATQHLSDVHDITMENTKTKQQKKHAAKEKKNMAFATQAYKDNPSRYNLLQFVKAFIISSACSFSIGENPNVRHCLSIMCPDNLDVEQLNNKMIKRIVIELYDDTSKKHSAAVVAAIRKAVVKILYVNVDIWQSKVSGEKFIGVRIFYMDCNGILRTYLLAVKLFRPDPSLGKITGEVVMKWARQVFADHGIAETDIAGTVTDAGADVSTGVGKAFPRRWCGPHMINRALIEGTGTSPSAAGALINPGCKSLLDSCKTVIEFLSRSTQSKLEDTVEAMSSGKGPKSKLSQAVTQRWTSICKMLMRFLQKWDALVAVYATKEKHFPLSGKKKDLEELYSIVRALKDFTVYCQKTHEATVERGMQKMVALMALTLEPAKPLPVLRVPAVIVVEGEGDGDGDGDDDLPATRTTEKRPHGDLTDLGRRTREVVQTSIAKRFFPRYGDGLLKRSHLFDRSMLLSPKMPSLEYLGSFAGSTAGKAFGMKPVSEIVARIHEEVINILTEAVIELRARAAKAAAAAPAGGDNLSGVKRAKTSHPSAAATQDEQDLRELGLLGDDNGSDNNDGEQPAPQDDAREEARSILKAWLETKFSVQHKGLDAAEYWRVHGSRHPLALRAVAQAVFGCPASAGVIERDFCIADWFMPRKRGSLDPAFLEMLLYLRAQFDYISNDVPSLTEQEAKVAVPNRLRDQAKLDEVNVLTFEAEEESAEESEDLGAEWVQGVQGGEGSGSGASAPAPAQMS